MTALIRSELIGLRTLRSTYLMPGALLVMIAIITVAAMGDMGAESTVAELREPVVAGAGIFGALVLALYAATRVGGEYRHRTIAQRLLAAPNRGRMLAAKLLTFGALAAVTAVLSLAVGLAIAQPLAAAKDLSLGLSGAALAEMAGSVILAVVMFALLGVSTAVIFASQSVGVAVVFGTFFVEKLIGPLIGSASAYLPYELLNSLLDMGGPVARATAALVLTAIAAATAVLATVLLMRRDVT